MGANVLNNRRAQHDLGNGDALARASG
jgi:hypothetical protein